MIYLLEDLHEGRLLLMVQSIEGDYATCKLCLDKPGDVWKEFITRDMPKTESWMAADNNLRCWLRCHKGQRADCSVNCWHLRQDRGWCYFFHCNIDTHLGYAFPLRCAKCMEWGAHAPG